MATSLNKVQLLGRVGKDPEVRSTPTGKALSTFNLATGKKWQDKTTKEWKESTVWHRCVAWEGVAQLVNKCVHKGDPLFVEGEITQEEWTDKDGVKRTMTKILVHQIILVGGKPKETNIPAESKESLKDAADGSEAMENDEDVVPF